MSRKGIVTLLGSLILLFVSSVYGAGANGIFYLRPLWGR